MGLFGVLRSLGRQAAAFPGVSVAIIGSVLYDTLFETAFPLLVAWIIDRAVLPGLPDQFTLPALLLASGWAVSVGSQVGRDFWLAQLVARVTERVRNRLEAALSGQDYAHLRGWRAAEWQALHGAELTQLENLFLQVLPPFLFGVFYLVFGVTAMLATHPGLGSLVVVLLPLTALGPWLLAARSQTQGEGLQKAEFEARTAAAELLSAQALLRTFDLGASFRRSFHQRTAALARWTRLFSFTSNLTRRLPNLTIHFAQLALVLAGTWLALGGNLALGELVAFNLLFANVLTAVLDLASTLGPLSRAAPSLGSLDRRIEGKAVPESSPRAESHPVARLSRGLRFEDVAFRYESARPLLEGVTFDVPAGQRTAVVGASGSGKSTLAALLSGLYRPSRGGLLWDANPADPSDFRSRMAIVFQENPVFDATLRYNITLGADHDDAEVWTALRQAGLAPWVAELPEGLETLAGEAGGFLSGGQRQRLALARALIRRPELLVLDEATSALDPLTEGLVNDQLRALTPATTILHISHRLPGIADYEHIVVLDQGRVAEVGTHHDLIQRPAGLYARLWQRQSGLVIAGPEARITPEGLRAIPLFGASSDETLAELSRSFVSETVAPGTKIIRQGQPGTRFFVIARGRVEVSLDRPSGPVTVASLADGDFFGEMALLDATTTSAHVTAVESTMVLGLEKTTFLALVARDPVLGQSVAEVARQRRDANARKS